MDPRDRLRLALLGAACSRCGRRYPVDGISILAQREEIAFVQLDCAGCGSQTLALVTGSPDDDVHQQPTWLSGSAAPQGLSSAPDALSSETAAAIDESDVREMAAFLAEYQGDLRGLLARRNRGAR